MDEGPADGRGHQHLSAAGLPMPPRVLARLVDIEAVMRMLDERNGQAARREARHQPFNERRLAAAGPAGESEEAHVSEEPWPDPNARSRRLRRACPEQARDHPPMHARLRHARDDGHTEALRPSTLQWPFARRVMAC